MFRSLSVKAYLPNLQSRPCTCKPATDTAVCAMIAAPFVIAALSGYGGFRMGYSTCEYDHYVARFKELDNDRDERIRQLADKAYRE